MPPPLRTRKNSVYSVAKILCAHCASVVKNLPPSAPSKKLGVLGGKKILCAHCASVVNNTRRGQPPGRRSIKFQRAHSRDATAVRFY